MPRRAERSGGASRVLAYARVSSAEQALGTSLADQQEVIGQYAKSRGLNVHRFYVEAESAVLERIEKREQIQLLLKEVRAGDLVLCDKLDRWSRDPEFTYGSIRRLLELGASFYAVGDRCDPSTRDGDTMLGVRVLVAREEHKRIKDRTVGTRRLLRDRGYYSEGQAPFGYVRPSGKGVSRLDHNVLQLDEKNAAIVREIFRMCVRGVSVWRITEHLLVAHPSRRWFSRNVGRIIRNRVYTGEMQDTRGEWIKGRHPVIIAPDLFAKAQAGLDSRRLRGPGQQSDSRTFHWLLRQIGRCARCRAKLSASYGGGTYVGSADYTYYYRCVRKCPGSRYMRVERFDEEVGLMVLDRLIELREQLAKGPEPKRERPAVDFAAERGRLQLRRDRYIEAFADASLTKDELRAKLAKVDEARLKLDAREAEYRRESPLQSEAVRREMLSKIDSIRRAWKAAQGHVRREVLHELATEVLLETGKTPMVVWRSPEEIAGDDRL